MTETILVVNAGSSSIKFQLFEVGAHDQLERRFKGQIDGIGTRPHLLARDVQGETLVDETWPEAEVSNVPAALDKVMPSCAADGRKATNRDRPPRRTWRT